MNMQGTFRRVGFRSLRPLCLLLAAVGLAACRPASSSLPEPIRENGRIAFVSDRDGDEEICVMNADGSGQTCLTHNRADDGGPAWSPSLAQIAFTSRRDGNDEIYTVSVAAGPPGSGSSRQINLTNHPADDWGPMWSPDGTRIAFASNRDGPDEIYVMNEDGSDPTRLTHNSAQDGGATWSPDGSRIAFHSDRENNFDIYVMGADGWGQSRLTWDPADDGGPAWSPDGRSIAFISNRDGNFEIYVMNADGSGQTNVTKDPANDFSPTWSSEALEIVYFSDRDGNYEIYRMKADGTARMRLTDNQVQDFRPAWEPSSRTVQVSQAEPSERPRGAITNGARLIPPPIEPRFRSRPSRLGAPLLAG